MTCDVIVYSHEQCVPCRAVKAFLAERDIPFVLRNVVRDRVALAEFQRMGFLLPPVTVINGVAVRGYDPEKLDSLLDAAGC